MKYFYTIFPIEDMAISAFLHSVYVCGHTNQLGTNLILALKRRSILVVF